MRSLVRALLVAALLAVLGGASAAFAAPKVKTTTDVKVDKAATPPDAKTTTPPAKKLDLCDFVGDILSGTRFPDGTTPAQVKQYVIDVLTATRLPDGVDLTKPIDSCLPGTTKPDTKPDPKPDPKPSKPSHDDKRDSHTDVVTAAPQRSTSPTFAG